MNNEQGTERALTWADDFIYGLLGDAEKHQEVLRDLSDDAIRSTINKLDTTSEEFLTGLNVLTYKADLEVKKSFAEAEEQIGEQAFRTLTGLGMAITEADDETWERIFDIERDLDKADNMTKDEVDNELDRLNAENEGWKRSVEEWLTTADETLHDTLWGWIPELADEAALYLAALPARLLFSLAKEFFFEED